MWTFGFEVSARRPTSALLATAAFPAMATRAPLLPRSRFLRSGKRTPLWGEP